MLSENVERLIECKLRTGRLPLKEPVQLLSDVASGDKLCTACGRHIAMDSSQIQEIYADGSSVFYHAQCGHYVSTARARFLAERVARNSPGEPSTIST